MSASQQKTSVPAAEGKAPSIDGVATQDASSFELAIQIQQLLKGVSNRKALEALKMVASLRDLRVIPMDRPIGQSIAGKQLPPGKVAQPKAKRGKPTPPAAWKQTDDYRRLSTERVAAVAALKIETSEEVKAGLLSQIHAFEQSLKDLRQSRSGN